MRRLTLVLLLAILGSMMLTACSGNQTSGSTPDTLIVYSGRTESLVGPLIEQFKTATGIDVQVRYGGTAELAATLLEEGEASPADVYFAQDPGGLGAIADAGLLSTLPADILGLVDVRFADPAGHWIGISGRARVVVYNTTILSPTDLPDDIWDFSDPMWQGRIGLPPTNASFQTMVTGMRQVWETEKTRTWLEGIMANNPIFYENNTATVAAVAAGEVEVGFVNHYYLFRFLTEEGEGFAARNYFLPAGGPGSLIMVAGAGILESSSQKELAAEFIRYLLSADAQQYFANETFEYPLVAGIDTHPELTPLGNLNAVSISLGDLSDLQGTVLLMQDVGMLP